MRVRVVGEPVHRATELMLRDVLHFPDAKLTLNRTRDYTVVALRELPNGAGETTVEAAEGLRYNLSDRHLTELGAEVVSRKERSN